MFVHELLQYRILNHVASLVNLATTYYAQVVDVSATHWSIETEQIALLARVNLKQLRFFSFRILFTWICCSCCFFELYEAFTPTITYSLGQ